EPDQQQPGEPRPHDPIADGVRHVAEGEGSRRLSGEEDRTEGADDGAATALGRAIGDEGGKARIEEAMRGAGEQPTEEERGEQGVRPGPVRGAVSRRAGTSCHTSAPATPARSAEPAARARKPRPRMIHSPTSGASAVDTKPDTP